MSPPVSGEGPSSVVSAFPDFLDGYSRLGLEIDRSLAVPVSAFRTAMQYLPWSAANADIRIPWMVGPASDEHDQAVQWLAGVEEIDGWVAKVAAAFRAADDRPSPLLSATEQALDSALAALPTGPDGLQISGGQLVGPDGELFDIFVPPKVDGRLRVTASGDLLPSPPCATGEYNADYLVTADDPTSVAQTNNGSDPGWITVGRPLVGLTTIDAPTFWERALASLSPIASVNGEAAAPADYAELLGTLGLGDPGPLAPAPGALPPSDPPEAGAPPRAVATGAAVEVLAAIAQAVINNEQLDNAASLAYQVTFERNAEDGRTRAIVRFYQYTTLPGAVAELHAWYGSVAPAGNWTGTAIEPKPPAYPSIRAEVD